MFSPTFRLWWANSRRVRLWFWLNVGSAIWLLSTDTVPADWMLMGGIAGISGGTLLLDYLAWRFRY